MTHDTVSAIVQIFVPEDRKQISGVGRRRYEATRQAFEVSRRRAFFVLALISLSLGVINLFPFLPLDGGHIFWALAEKVRGRRDPVRVDGARRLHRLRARDRAVRRRAVQRHRPDRRRGLQVACAHAGRATRRAVGAATIAEAFRITVEDRPDRVAVRTLDDEVSLTWSELRDRVGRARRRPRALGVRRGDTVALMLGNRPEFHVADLAAMTLGATPFSIYLTSSPEQVAYVVARRRRARGDRRAGASATAGRRRSSST